jgi:hypothetical protein
MAGLEIDDELSYISKTELLYNEVLNEVVLRTIRLPG